MRSFNWSYFWLFIGSFFTSLFFYIGIKAVIAGSFQSEGMGIHPHGKHAVYIEGEACTINFTSDRTDDEMIADFWFCFNKHKELNIK